MGAMISITPSLAIDEDEITETFMRASGPGGQNVNKVSTAVELRFNVGASPNLLGGVRARLRRLAGRRLTKDDILIIRADRHRTQEMNRADARARLVALIAEAAVIPKVRVKTRPSRASKERRLEGKVRRGAVKGLRRVKPGMD